MQLSKYTKWSSLFITMCGKFDLLSYIDGSAADPDNELWSQADCVVKSWIQCSIVDDVFNLASDQDQTAHDLWSAVRDLFRDNKETHAVFLHNQFHTLVQGDLTVTEYGTRVKQVADILRDVGHPV